MTTNKELLETYMIGFQDEFLGKDEKIFDESRLQKAYNLGAEYAMLRTEDRNFERSEEEILELINCN